MIPVAKPIIGAAERTAVAAVLASGMLAQGAEVAAFETEFAEVLTPGRAAVAVNSGTSALHLGLLAAGIGPGDEVLVPSFTFAATANAVALTGALPVFVDIEPDHFTMSPRAAAAAISDRTRALLPVHLFGHPCDVPALSALAAKHDLLLFEDAAQAHLASWQGRPTGTFGHFAAFSLYPTKNMTSGEGGMVTSAEADLLDRVRLLRNQGMAKQYENKIVGYNNRMTDIHAAIGRAQLAQLPTWTTTRQANAAFLDAELHGVLTPKVATEACHVYHQYTIRVPEDRDGFATALRTEYGVGCGVYYPTPCHQLASYARDLDLPQTERAAAQVLSLPVHPALSQADLDQIVTAVNRLAKAGA